MWWSVPKGVTEFGTWRELTTVYHEGVPGPPPPGRPDRLPLGAAQPLAPARCRWVSGHGEGWALYAERLMADLGYMDDPGNRMGLLDGQSLRAARVVLDIGVPLRLRGTRRGGRRQLDLRQGLEFLSAHANMAEGFLRFELDRYLGWPGQAPSYKIGERIWLQLRDEVARPGRATRSTSRRSTAARSTSAASAWTRCGPPSWADAAPGGTTGAPWCCETSLVSVAITALALLATVTAVAGLARRFDLSAPLLLTLVGVVASFLPFVPEVQLSSEVVLVGLLPPLLYAAAIRSSLVDFKANRRPIGLLSVGLVHLHRARRGAGDVVAAAGAVRGRVRARRGRGAPGRRGGDGHRAPDRPAPSRRHASSRASRWSTTPRRWSCLRTAIAAIAGRLRQPSAG